MYMIIVTQDKTSHNTVRIYYSNVTHIQALNLNFHRVSRMICIRWSFSFHFSLLSFSHIEKVKCYFWRKKKKIYDQICNFECRETKGISLDFPKRDTHLGFKFGISSFSIRICIRLSFSFHF